MQINASIVLYHTNKDQLKNIITCFLNIPFDTKLYLIDNSSNDDLKILKDFDTSIEYIYNNANLGYGAAHNIALRKSIENNATYHFILNSDILFNPNDIKTLVDYMDNNPDVGHLMPKVIYPDGQLQYLCKLLPTPYDLIVRRFIPFKRIKELNDSKYELRFSGYNKIMNVPYLSGCFMLLRISALKEIGLFDERYFMYPEDIDLTRRMHKNYKTIFFPYVTIIHDHAKSSYKNLKMMFIHIYNIIKYFNKWGWFFDKERKIVNKSCLAQLINK